MIQMKNVGESSRKTERTKKCVNKWKKETKIGWRSEECSALRAECWTGQTECERVHERIELVAFARTLTNRRRPRLLFFSFSGLAFTAQMTWNFLVDYSENLWRTIANFVGLWALATPLPSIVLWIWTVWPRERLCWRLWTICVRQSVYSSYVIWGSRHTH